ncbi:nucleoporin-interacting protein NIC96 [Pterulicium gracile]|uniref:Nuclear pore protein n=1 Tax=Pterulicium gracile TaxID=1884261 RepID=A0A5C3QEU9_9AGAR|nr:nucleoporin-interacting protein NIC96 [Pterula gracilis]
MASNLASLLDSSKALTSHLSRPDLPSIQLSLEQIEAQSRRLVTKQHGVPNDTDRANYLLAQAHVDVPALSNSIAHLNTAATFAPLQPLQDTDVAGYLRHAHEQNLISTIEEGRRATQEEFYRVLEERNRRDWEAKKRRVFEELGGRVGADNNKAMMDLKKSYHSKGALNTSVAPSISLAMQSKMAAYHNVVSELNSARLKGTSYPVVHSLINAALAVNGDTYNLQMAQNFHVLSKITLEPPSVASVEQAGTHNLNIPRIERKFARAYLGDPESRDAISLRKQISNGARVALEEQYWDVVERTIQSHPMEAQLGGDPSVANKIRAFLFVRYYKHGEWQDRIELIGGQPLWAKLFFLIRTGHGQDALDEALKHRTQIERREASFVSHLRTWLESPERRLPKTHRDHLQTVYNSHMLHSQTADPFKLALYKLIGKLEPSRRSVAQVTTTIEDWLWFQLTMVDEDEEGGLRGLADVLLGYGERHFDGVPGQKGSRRGVWAGVLLMCGQFERAVAALWEYQETEVEAVHLGIALAYHGLLRLSSRAETSDMTPLTISPAGPPSLSLSTIVWRYVRQFVKMDAKEAMQYVYCVCLSSDQGDGVGKEQVEGAWELVRRIIVLANTGAAWEELVGGFRTDGVRFSGIIEQGASLLQLTDSKQLNEQILTRAAQNSHENDRISEAVKLYNLAGDYTTVIGCLAQALGNTIAQPTPDEKARNIEKTACEILRHYERTNRGVGKDRDAVVRLLRIRSALDAKVAGRPEVALEIMESTELIPLDGEIAKITRRAEEFKDLHESLQRNLQVYLPLTMDSLAGVYHNLKSSSMAGDTTRQGKLRKKSRSIMVFAGILKYRMSSDVYSYLARLDVEIAL